MTIFPLLALHLTQVRDLSNFKRPKSPLNNLSQNRSFTIENSRDIKASGSTDGFPQDAMARVTCCQNYECPSQKGCDPNLDKAFRLARAFYLR